MTLREQLADLLADQLQRVGGALGRPELTAVDLDAAVLRGERILTGSDDHAAAELVSDLYAITCGQHPEPPVGWWTTPLGRITAGSIGLDGSDAVSMSNAAQMLGISRQAVRGLAQRGTLDAHPDSGVTRASVMARLAAAR